MKRDMKENKTRGTRDTAVRLLFAAYVLMLLAGAIFAFIGQWVPAVLIWAGAFGCLTAALNFRNRKDK